MLFFFYIIEKRHSLSFQLSVSLQIHFQESFTALAVELVVISMQRLGFPTDFQRINREYTPLLMASRGLDI